MVKLFEWQWDGKKYSSHSSKKILQFTIFKCTQCSVKNLVSKYLFLHFRVEKSRYFRRDGADVHTEAEISLSQAILGGTIRVQGVYDDQTIQVKMLTEKLMIPTDVL